MSEKKFGKHMEPKCLQYIRGKTMRGQMIQNMFFFIKSTNGSLYTINN